MASWSLSYIVLFLRVVVGVKRAEASAQPGPRPCPHVGGWAWITVTSEHPCRDPGTLGPSFLDEEILV